MSGNDFDESAVKAFDLDAALRAEGQAVPRGSQAQAYYDRAERLAELRRARPNHLVADRPDLAWCGHAHLDDLLRAARVHFLALPAGDESRRLATGLVAAIHGLRTCLTNTRR